MAATDRPLRRDAERNRLRILSAATEVFAQRGLDASLDQVAERAGVGVGTVYRRFADKDALIEALFEQRIQAVADSARAALAVADPWEGFLDFLQEIVTQQAADRGLKEAMLSRGRDRADQARADVHPLLGELIARAQADGRLRPDFTIPDFYLVSLMVSDIADLTREDSPELWRRVLALILDGIVTARAAPSPLPAPAPAPDELAEAARRRRR